jgi:hypothetical protein
LLFPLGLNLLIQRLERRLLAKVREVRTYPNQQHQAGNQERLIGVKFEHASSD